MNTRSRLLQSALLFAAALALPNFLPASIPDAVPYQGRIAANGVNFTGTGQFKFAIYEHTTGLFLPAAATSLLTGQSVTSVALANGGGGYSASVSIGFAGGGGSGAAATATVAGGVITRINVTAAGSGYTSAPAVVITDANGPSLHWTNSTGPTSGALVEPANYLKVEIVGGSYVVGLGDTAVANMAPLPASLAPSASKRTFVRAWFNDGSHGFQPLLPDTELGSVPFAREAVSAASVGGVAATDLARLDVANTFTHVNGLTVQGAGPAGGSPGTGAAVPVAGAGTRLEFLPGFSALRAGTVGGDQWDAANIGLYSTAIGQDTIARGLAAVALGSGTSANGPAATALGSGTLASGNSSTACGWDSRATGLVASAFGQTTTASGLASTATGSFTTASGTYATAMGYATGASGLGATAAGGATAAAGNWSAAFGEGSRATSYGQLAVGTFNIERAGSANTWRSTNPLFVIGNGTDDGARSDALVVLQSGDTTLNGSLQLSDVDGLAVHGAGPVDSTPAAGATVPLTGAGTRLLFLPGYGAFRAGTVTGTQWDAAKIGLWSTALGYNTTASGACSTALGNGTTASGGGATALGWGSTASGNFSLASGISSTASGDLSLAIGSNARAAGIGAMALGISTRATGNYSTASGLSTAATGTSATAIGANLTAGSCAEIALGQFNTVATPASATEWNAADRLFGIGNGTADDARSDALVVFKNGSTTVNGALRVNGLGGVVVTGTGPGTAPAPGATVPLAGAGTRLEFIPGYGAFRAGTVTGTQWDASNIGIQSIALGYNATAKGKYSVALGFHPTASGDMSVALGQLNTASGADSVAMGHDTTASGLMSTAAGFGSIASGAVSTALGYMTTAESGCETVVGRYNTDYAPASTTEWNPADRLFVVGNGSNWENRSDALIVFKNGNATLKGTLTQGSDRNRKTDIVPADTAAVLTKVAALPVSTWKYKDETVTHLGPMAQDFFAAFQLGGTDAGIASVDADGVALAAIQELKKQLDAKEARIATLEARLAALEAKLAK